MTTNPLLLFLFHALRPKDASPYHDVRNVPMIASPLFKVPVPKYHDFVLEHRIVQEYQRIISEEVAQTAAKEQRYRAYVEEREARLKQERISRARKIAPGFLDSDDRRILTPTLASAAPASSSGSPANQSPAIKHQPAIDYSEFELHNDTSANKPASDAEDNAQPKETDSTASPVVAAATAAATAAAATATPDTSTVGNVDDTVEDTELSDDVVRPHEATGEQIVRAVPLSELTGLLRDSALGSSTETAPSSRPQAWNTAPEKSATSVRVDFREFEQGLGPPDPWEAPVDDMAALKDVISQQLGQPSNPTVLASHPVHQQDPTATQPLRSFHTTDPYAHLGPSKHGLNQTPTHSMTAPPSYSVSNDMHPVSTGHFHSSPLPMGTSAGVAKQHQQILEYNQAYMIAQQHQQQSSPLHLPQPHRHSTTGLSTSQQHARFGSSSPSPPPLPPPPREFSSSPLSAGTLGSQPRPPAVPGPNQPPVPARPSQLQASASGVSPADGVVIMDRSLSATGGIGGGGPPRPPLPPPPPPPSQHPKVSPAIPARPPRRDEGPDVSGDGGIGGVGGGADHADIASHLSSPEQQLPLPENASMLIEQLVNMGFSHEQSREALEKYDYDVEKASNHLLDWG
ncbi:hypothetical protein BGZ73_005503 [Actinomortierella ambigua]|nr:hypothetical protein BGZ73_005503 [Actinomortierella ambigua]